MAEFSRDVIEAAARQREVQITTYGRKTGRPHRVTVWVSGDNGRLFVRSGGGLGQGWPQNLLAGGRGVLPVGGMDVPIRARHVTDVAETRTAAGHLVRKYPGEHSAFQRRPTAHPGRTGDLRDPSGGHLTAEVGSRPRRAHQRGHHLLAAQFW